MRKDNAKRIIVKHLAEGVHFKVEVAATQGGREQIMLTKNGFKAFCVAVKTDKARDVRDHYVTMEDLYKCHKINHLEKALANAAIGFRVHGMYKFGQTENLNSRMKAHLCSNPLGMYRKTKYCNDSKAPEKAVLHILRAYKAFPFKDNDEWLVIPLDVLSAVIDKVQLFIDDHVGLDIALPPPPTPDALLQMFPGHEISLTGQPKPKFASTPLQVPPSHEQAPPPLTALAAPNFDSFIDDCFDLNDEAITPWIDIKGRCGTYHRVLPTKAFSAELKQFLNMRNFPLTDMHDGTVQTTYTAFKGLSMKPLDPLPISEQPSHCEQFVRAKCVRSTTGRISIKDLGESFTSWMQEGMPAYELTKADRKSLASYFSKEFVGGSIFTGERNREGYHGVTIVGSRFELSGRKCKPNNWKAVQQVDASTNEVVKEYTSVTCFFTLCCCGDGGTYKVPVFRQLIDLYTADVLDTLRDKVDQEQDKFLKAQADMRERHRLTAGDVAGNNMSKVTTFDHSITLLDVICRKYSVVEHIISVEACKANIVLSRFKFNRAAPTITDNKFMDEIYEAYMARDGNVSVIIYGLPEYLMTLGDPYPLYYDKPYLSQPVAFYKQIVHPNTKLRELIMAHKKSAMA